MQSAEILDELAAQTDGIREFFGATFELLEDYWALADARLSAFSSEQMWAVAIEVVGYDAKSDEFALHVCLFGNCLNLESASFDFRRTILVVPDSWNKELEKDQVWGLARDQFSLLYRGQRHDFAPTIEDLQKAGIELSAREIESGELTPPQMLRYVCEQWNHPFWMSEDALRDLLDRFSLPFEWKYDKKTERSWFQNELGEFSEPPLLSVALELVLQTRDWTHPRAGLADGAAGEWEISPHQAFKTLAQTLSTRDVAAWNAQDAAVFNSHWRNWAEIEANTERQNERLLSDAKIAFRALVEQVPLTQRRKYLEHLRPTIEKAPSLSNWSFQQHIDRDGVIAQIFSELLPDVDAMLADLRQTQ